MGSSMPGLTRHSNKMKRLMSDINDLRTARRLVVSRLDQDIDVAIEKSEEEAWKFFGLQAKPRMGGYWPCPESPNGTCWYRGDDRKKDECIVCGEPEERK